MLVFFGNNSYLHLVCFLQVLARGASSFLYVFVATVCSFFALLLFPTLFSMQAHTQCIVDKILCVFLLFSCFAFLLYKSVGFARFALARFAFFLQLFANCV